MQKITLTQYDTIYAAQGALLENVQLLIANHAIECLSLTYYNSEGVSKDIYTVEYRVIDMHKYNDEFRYENCITAPHDQCESVDFYVFDDERECRDFIASLITDILNKVAFEAA